MNNLVHSAIALSLFAAPSLAADNGWAGLDKEIESLSTTLAQEAPKGPTVGGYLITSYRYSSDEAVAFAVDQNGDGDTTDAGETDTGDRSGINIDRLRLSLEGKLVDNYSYKVSFELGDSTGQVGTLRDAYVNWAFAEGFELRMGRFRQPFLQSSLISRDKLLFLDRSAAGDLVGQRDEGVALMGKFETLKVWVAGQNGADGQADDYLITGRVRANVMGGGAYEKVEGAYGAAEETNLSVGAAVADEGAVDDGLHYGVEAQLVAGPFSVAAELVDFDESIGRVHPFAGNLVGDTTIWGVTASYLITNEYEVALRYEDADDDNDSTRWAASLLRYVDGHNLKWILQYSSVQSDLDALEIDQIGLGIALSL